ncbi:MAG: AbrB/MazE/SpoVT family DNA-binding domain-containing protein [Nanoarchaeota archaeon]|nr:AbrB/MazE/SpoVT family DNA-binding domain-containing protein [Nanoarchaeota archaeon]
MSLTKINERGQLTIPAELRKVLHCEPGDYVEVVMDKDVLKVIPKMVINKDQAWFWTKEWQEGEREADRDLKAGKMSGSFKTANELGKHLGKN